MEICPSNEKQCVVIENLANIYGYIHRIDDENRILIIKEIIKEKNNKGFAINWHNHYILNRISNLKVLLLCDEKVRMMKFNRAIEDVIHRCEFCSVHASKFKFTKTFIIEVYSLKIEN